MIMIIYLKAPISFEKRTNFNIWPNGVVYYEFKKNDYLRYTVVIFLRYLRKFM
jgi:hypothetical protein